MDYRIAFVCLCIFSEGQDNLQILCALTEKIRSFSFILLFEVIFQNRVSERFPLFLLKLVGDVAATPIQIDHKHPITWAMSQTPKYASCKLI
jgi:hypothetical protein